MGKYLNSEKVIFQSQLSLEILHELILSFGRDKAKVYQQPHHPNVFEIRSTELLWLTSWRGSKYLIDLRLSQLKDCVELQANVRGNEFMNLIGIVLLMIIPFWSFMLIVTKESVWTLISTAIIVIVMTVLVIYVNLKYRERGVKEFLRFRKSIEKLEVEMEIKENGTPSNPA